MMTTRIKALGTVGAIPLRPLCVTKNEEIGLSERILSSCYTGCYKVLKNSGKNPLFDDKGMTTPSDVGY